MAANRCGECLKKLREIDRLTEELHRGKTTPQEPTPHRLRATFFDIGIKPEPEVPMVIQERAYTSPIWYTPGQWRA